MPQTIRQFYQNLHGRSKINFNWGAIDHDSVVLISASEYFLDDIVPDSNDHHRFIGDANVTVCNIATHGPPFDPNHGVTFVVQIDWQTPINIVADITVMDKPVDVEPQRYKTNFGGEGDG